LTVCANLLTGMLLVFQLTGSFLASFLIINDPFDCC
jgi:hypothetical protein